MQNEKTKKFFSSKAARSVVIIAAVLLVGLAVYLNYRWFYDPIGSLGYGDNNMDDNVDGSETTGGESEEEYDYFSTTVLNRQNSRDEAIDVLKLVTENEEASEEARAEAAAKISKIAVDIQNEANIETLVKAKGIGNCVAVISGDSCSVIVNQNGLLPDELTQITDIVFEQTGIPVTNITVVEAKKQS